MSAFIARSGLFKVQYCLTAAHERREKLKCLFGVQGLLTLDACVVTSISGRQRPKHPEQEKAWLQLTSSNTRTRPCQDRMA